MTLIPLFLKYQRNTTIWSQLFKEDFIKVIEDYKTFLFGVLFFRIFFFFSLQFYTN